MWRFIIAAVAGISAAIVVLTLCHHDSPQEPAATVRIRPGHDKGLRADIDALIKGLRSPDAPSRSLFSRNLIRETGMFFGFKPADLPEEREAAVKRWEEWWAANREKTKEQWLADSLSMQDYEGKVLTLKTLAEMESTGAVPEIVKILDGEDAELKFEAIRTLGKLKTEKAVPKLIAMLEPGEAPRVRHAAARSLGQIGEEEGLVALEHTAEGADALTRIEAASALMIRAPERAVRVLHSLLTDGNNEAKQFAINALSSLKKPESIPHLVPLLSAEKPVAEAAHRALFTIVGIDLGQEPEPWLKWHQESMKENG
jgi:hypothetical protein